MTRVSCKVCCSILRFFVGFGGGGGFVSGSAGGLLLHCCPELLPLWSIEQVVLQHEVKIHLYTI